MTGINLYAENISSNVNIASQTQSFTWTTQINQMQFVNNFTPTSLAYSQNCLELINVNNAGYRFKQITSNTLTIGNLVLESFTGGALPGTPLLAIEPETNPTIPIILMGNSGLSSFALGIQTLNPTAGFVGISCIDSSGTNQVNIGYSPSNFYGILATNTAIPFILGANNGRAITILSNQNVGIGSSVTSPSYQLDVGGTIRSNRLLGNSHAPTVVLGSACGSSPSSTITGSEVGGTFSVTTGSGATTGLIGTFTLSASSGMPSSTFSIMLTSANAAAATISKWEASTSSSTFTFNAITGLAASTTYIWNYQIVGY
jgi:hypothetical protein